MKSHGGQNKKSLAHTRKQRHALWNQGVKVQINCLKRRVWSTSKWTVLWFVCGVKAHGPTTTFCNVIQLLVINCLGSNLKVICKKLFKTFGNHLCISPLGRVCLLSLYPTVCTLAVHFVHKKVCDTVIVQ